MTNPPARWFLLLFVAVTGLEILGDVSGVRWLHYGCKPLIMGLLLVWSRQQSIPTSRSLWLLRVGMVFALLGDVFLMIREVDLFGLGLASFLVMQVLYSLSFSTTRGFGPVSVKMVGLYALSFVLYSVFFLANLRPAFVEKPALQPLWIPVLLYVFCLTGMGLMASLRRRLPGYGAVLLGAILFILSDSAIAINAFLSPFDGATLFIMSTYAAAQYLIVTNTHPTK
ncbi:lysoplasmalogenase [Spirosoma montaniterrae]|uniref:Lysoplasmalogenase n=1 Tax=Spirosoma montaniterrae TaxID=1178516 RepID=A0A1P9WS70_9BACT|nr:lysoplasmalogenase [Spirosoma montaniterrae]AQG78193.1 hypothetical protein AWR27_01825 [Spirosoma montaniterrae]